MVESINNKMAQENSRLQMEEKETDEIMEEEEEETYDEDTGAKVKAPTFYSDADKYWKVTSRSCE